MPLPACTVLSIGVIVLINDCLVAASFISNRYLLADSPNIFFKYRKVRTTFILVNTVTPDGAKPPPIDGGVVTAPAAAGGV